MGFTDAMQDFKRRMGVNSPAQQSLYQNSHRRPSTRGKERLAMNELDLAHSGIDPSNQSQAEARLRAARMLELWQPPSPRPVSRRSTNGAPPTRSEAGPSIRPARKFQDESKDNREHDVTTEQRERLGREDALIRTYALSNPATRRFMAGLFENVIGRTPVVQRDIQLAAIMYTRIMEEEQVDSQYLCRRESMVRDLKEVMCKLEADPEDDAWRRSEIILQECYRETWDPVGGRGAEGCSGAARRPVQRSSRESDVRIAAYTIDATRVPDKKRPNAPCPRLEPSALLMAKNKGEDAEEHDLYHHTLKDIAKLPRPSPTSGPLTRDFALSASKATATPEAINASRSSFSQNEEKTERLRQSFDAAKQSKEAWLAALAAEDAAIFRHYPPEDLEQARLAQLAAEDSSRDFVGKGRSTGLYGVIEHRHSENLAAAARSSQSNMDKAAEPTKAVILPEFTSLALKRRGRIMAPQIPVLTSGSGFGGARNKSDGGEEEDKGVRRTSLLADSPVSPIAAKN
ncbi:hypothetical protein LTR78_005751 [Recurvomyces mirabilis]|uniref:Uncharacterized protein n=1 Tax=Recurvomyces mirabilis TaxID=574656 RepID=A0AAE0WM81_9PEZI|nr:hypothetical protein LTR78_005751 [Recurvomyces mirabilis]KAK5154130.1 hypothetical protein LTS14_006815 [Recurvomyces mirabilis]